jgi:hypothetical protein
MAKKTPKLRTPPVVFGWPATTALANATPLASVCSDMPTTAADQERETWPSGNGSS